MNFQEIVCRLDTLLQNCRLEEAEQLLADSIAEARAEQNTEAEKYLVNEQIGFYRDCGNFPKALQAAQQARALFEHTGDTGSISYATTLLNCANAYRAAGKYDDALAAFAVVKRIYDELLPENDHRIASFYNNLALLYQETEQWTQACDCLNCALALVRKEKDETRIAISCANLAVSLLHLKNTHEAFQLLTEADGILAGRSPSDFHYSAVLSGFGDAYYQMGQYQKAADFYEQALSEIELHMGQNNFYAIVSENLAEAYAKLGVQRPKLTGLELSRRFFTVFGAPMLEKNFPDVLRQLAIGLAGEGSECLGYDDELSQDHDFGAAFCIWVPDTMPSETVEQLQKAYDLLPVSYMGIRRLETKHAKGRTGVCRIGDFFNRLLQIQGLPETEEEWLRVDEAMLAAACSGEIFRDFSGEMTRSRRKLSMGYPEAVRLRRLAQQLALMAQSGQYNYVRMRKRGDFATAQLYLSKFCICAMRAAHLCCRVYAPYEKWLLRSTAELNGFAEYADAIRMLLTMPPQTTCVLDEATDPVCSQIQKICKKIVWEATQEMTQENVYLEQPAQQLAEKAEQLERHEALVQQIVQLEWQAFDVVQNLGGRASCQDDWETFSIMRSSQYRMWPSELLEKWVTEFRAASESGRNLITEKYARMMESTDPEKYVELQQQLPVIPEDFIKIREAIVAIQVTWMDAFAERYPKLASNARTIHTAQDSVFETSYETYLRGELTTYSFDMLYAYGRWITSLHRDGKNLAFLIMEETVHAYGYPSLDAAEK